MQSAFGKLRLGLNRLAFSGSTLRRAILFVVDRPQPQLQATDVPRTRAMVVDRPAVTMSIYDFPAP